MLYKGDGQREEADGTNIPVSDVRHIDGDSFRLFEETSQEKGGK